jgi:hypothetical protein
MKYFTADNPLKFEYNGNNRDEPSWRDIFKNSAQKYSGTHNNAGQSRAIKEITKLSSQNAKFTHITFKDPSLRHYDESEFRGSIFGLRRGRKTPFSKAISLTLDLLKNHDFIQSQHILESLEISGYDLAFHDEQGFERSYMTLLDILEFSNSANVKNLVLKNNNLGEVEIAEIIKAVSLGKITTLDLSQNNLNQAAIAALEQLCINQPALQIIKNDQKSVGPAIKVNKAKSSEKPVVKHSSNTANIIPLVNSNDDFLDENPQTLLGGIKKAKKTSKVNTVNTDNQTVI